MANTKTHLAGSNETTHINGNTIMLNTGRTDGFKPPGVVKISVAGLAVIAMTTRIPACVT
ncbi:hypothetical protein KSF_074110 [Reticulibacter mediterranei]|uniref:Uncharacterized protein n=1 Tax=Reticulibacter mediterranei TaxID=2778369 RepID=A0A8J3IRP2_9CHLR|nr:hypothetical protein KSF_074110 [Reticulibacter mediterranei]